MNEYEKQARDFLARNGLDFKAVRCVPQKRPPNWEDDKLIHGHWWIEINRPGKSDDYIAFDFWTSHNDETAYRGQNFPLDDKAQRETLKARKGPTAYDVLSGLSNDANCPSDYADFCAEFGYELDSRKAEATFHRCIAFSIQLHRFFSSKELTELAEIQ